MVGETRADVSTMGRAKKGRLHWLCGAAILSRRGCMRSKSARFLPDSYIEKQTMGRFSVRIQRRQKQSATCASMIRHYSRQYWQAPVGSPCCCATAWQRCMNLAKTVQISVELVPMSARGAPQPVTVLVRCWRAGCGGRHRRLRRAIAFRTAIASRIRSRATAMQTRGRISSSAGLAPAGEERLRDAGERQRDQADCGEGSDSSKIAARPRCR